MSRLVLSFLTLITFSSLAIACPDHDQSSKQSEQQEELEDEAQD